MLDGFDYHDHLRISRAMEIELARLVNENGPPKTRGAPAINAGGIHVGENRGPRAVGIEIAQSVYRNISGVEG